MADNQILSEHHFTTEQQLASRYPNEIKQFWQHGHFDSFTGIDNIRINYAAFTQKLFKQNTAQDITRECIVIVPGRSEGYLKYKELCYDLFMQDYDIFIIDHRGQGISQRMLANAHKGYVVSFEHYSDDLDRFINTIVPNYCQSKPYLLAHSMGGAIAARYLQKKPQSIKAAVLSSPMIAINSGGLPKVLAETLIKTGKQLNLWFSKTPWYFIGQGNYKKTQASAAFATNSLMHSPLRYQHFIELYNATPAMQLGGVTVHWLAQSLNAKQKLLNDLDKLSTPLLIIQAGADNIVDNAAQDQFCQQLNRLQPQSCPDGKPLVIEGAFHELFFESDQYRDQALSQAINWFKQYSSL